MNRIIFLSIIALSEMCRIQNLAVLFYDSLYSF